MAHGNRNPKPGDLIEIKRSRLYQHWALYVGDGYVVHVTDVGPKDVVMSVSSGSNLSGKAQVKKQLLKDVVGNDAWVVNNKYDQSHTPLPVEDIIKGAERLIGMEVEYSVLLRNCEHFVTLLRYEKKFSDQV
ncbi:HRSL1 enzyme, partial [Lanius ludovicianus]|nr:HRSL1 enzyme [Lanius ludovicianus]